MLKEKAIAIIAAGALAACLGLAGCGGQAASSSAASSSASTAASSTASSTSTSATAATSASTSASTASSAAAPAASTTASAAAASSAAASTSSYIGDQAAMDIALKHAGFAASDVTDLKCELDLNDAVVHYDVDFKRAGMEYDYDIDAKSGAIISSKSEVDN